MLHDMNMTPMISKSSPSSPVFVFAIIFLACSSFPSTVRSSHFNPLLLPSDLNHDDHLCPRLAQTTDSCPVKCFRTDPVCGVDGVTYWCGCADAHCAGTRVAKLGFCEVGNGGSAPVSGQALLLVHIIWLILLGIFVLFGLL